MPELLALAGVLLLAFAAFDLAVLRWGVDSRDGLQSQEWQRRRDWTW